MRSSRRSVARIGALLGVLVFGGLVIPPASVAQPLGDAVTGADSTPLLSTITFDVHSGPSGENATGTVFAHVQTPTLDTELHGTATCLAVSGNVAVVNTPTIFPTAPDVGAVWRVTDSPNGAPDIVELSVGPSQPPGNCSFPLGSIRDLDFGGNLVVVDAQPFPTSKDQCKNGGWRSFGETFKNQGQCVAFVQRGPKP